MPTLNSSFFLFPSAAKLMGQAGPTVVLEIGKQAAVHHGLAPLLSQSSPATSPGKQHLRLFIIVPRI